MENENNLNKIEEEVLMNFVSLLIINGFSVDIIEGWKFKVWLRGTEPDFAFIVFEVFPETVDVKVLEAGGEYSRFKYSKRHREFFEQTIKNLYYRAVLERES